MTTGSRDAPCFAVQWSQFRVEGKGKAGSREGFILLHKTSAQGFPRSNIDMMQHAACVGLIEPEELSIAQPAC